MLAAVSRFCFIGRAISCQRYGNGHINDTYLVKTNAGRDYILQRVNRRVFADIPALMGNIVAVTEYLRRLDPDPRHTLRVIKTTDGADFTRDGAGEYWRAYDFVTDSLCLESAQSAEDFYQSAVAFGTFQKQLADFPADTLHETIPRFHDTPARYAALRGAARADSHNRLREVRRELDFALAREPEAGTMTALLAAGELPLRVTHNDTKLNNVMLDAATRTPLCVIDLDTVMPGLAANDFGDSIRFGAATAPEGETDLTKVACSLTLYEAYARGFLRVCGDSLTALERETLPWGARLMTLECGVRFLTDYLQGDVYFAVKNPGQNIARCRTQFALVADMERKWREMNDIVRALGRGGGRTQ